MAILRSVDGQFYEVPDDQLAKFLIPADKVKEKLGTTGEDAGPPPSAPPPGSHGPGPAIIVQIFGAASPPSGPPPTGEAAPGAAAGAEVQPYAGWWNTWRNTFGPHWHNVWRNVHF